MPYLVYVLPLTTLPIKVRTVWVLVIIPKPFTLQDSLLHPTTAPDMHFQKPDVSYVLRLTPHVIVAIVVDTNETKNTMK